MDIPVQVVEEGVIQALGPPDEGGSGLYTTDVKRGDEGILSDPAVSIAGREPTRGLRVH